MDILEMLMDNYVELDPREYYVEKNDVITLSNGHDLEWLVTKVLKDRVYIRSVVGGRFGIVTLIDIATMKRDFSVPEEFDNTVLYGLSNEEIRELNLETTDNWELEDWA